MIDDRASMCGSPALEQRLSLVSARPQLLQPSAQIAGNSSLVAKRRHRPYQIEIARCDPFRGADMPLLDEA